MNDPTKGVRGILESLRSRLAASWDGNQGVWIAMLLLASKKEWKTLETNYVTTTISFVRLPDKQTYFVVAKDGPSDRSLQLNRPLEVLPV